MNGKERSCPTGVLVDFANDPKSPLTMEGISPSRGNKLSLIDMDEKQFLTPNNILKIPSPRSMFSISQEASKIVRRLEDSKKDVESTLLTDEVFPMRLSFDNLSFEETVSKDINISLIANVSNVTIMECDESAMPHLLPAQKDIKISPFLDGNCVSTVECNKSSIYNTNSAAMQGSSCVKKDVFSKKEELLTSESMTIKQLNTPKGSKSFKVKASSNEKENAFDDKDEISYQSKLRFSSIEPYAVIKAHDYDIYQKSNIKSLNKVLCTGTEVRQALSPLKNKPIPKSIYENDKRSNPIKNMIVSKLVFSEEDKKLHKASKLTPLRPRQQDFQKPSYRSDSQVAPSVVVHELQRSKSFQVKTSLDVHLIEQPVKQRSVSRSASACSSMDKRQFKTPLKSVLSVYHVKEMANIASERGRKSYTPLNSGRRNTLIASSNTTPLRTPRRASILPTSGSFNPRFATPLSSQDKLARRLSFVPAQLLSTGRKK